MKYKIHHKLGNLDFILRVVKWFEFAMAWSEAC